MVTRSHLSNCLGRRFQCKFLSNMPDVCNASKALGLSYSSQEEVSVVLDDRKIVCRKKVLCVLDSGYKKSISACRKLLDLMSDSV